MTVELSLVVPCFNEQNNVIELTSRYLRTASANNVATEIVFVDDCSSDQTQSIICEMQEMYPLHVRAVFNQSNIGIAGSWFIGLEAAEGNLICFIDADLQNPPEEVFRLLQTFRVEKCDVVRGIRCPEPSIINLRFFMSRVLNWLLNRYFGMTSGDNKSGFILTSRQLAELILRDHKQYQYFQTFVGVATESLGVHTIEIETPFHPRHSGESFLEHQSLSVAMKILREFPLAKQNFKTRKPQGDA